MGVLSLSISWGYGKVLVSDKFQRGSFSLMVLIRF